MALLSKPAIALLERLTSKWVAAEQLEVKPWDPALCELKTEGLAVTQLWPPVASRGVAWRLTSTRQQQIEVAITERGALRLQRLREGRRGR